ncbi:c2h2 type zinc finger domain-containing protein [Diplodia corticola]|uniref:C2h2 type zinc finger domain-containing protein n=1 Tax=Diplodia corticola TaxID=236234 RepID=A0A1J9R753_9PEZI|nr:c2h2 type zinc finger domain-containing protein [Diplodia corticola]OJD36042.1 c2h2 type zinc finger domain-containing protein [Diplodia corticola]
MDNARRDRSPSQGHQPHISPHASPSPHQSYQNIAGLGLDASSLTPDNSAFASAYDSSNTGQGYLSPTHQQQFASQPDIANGAFLHTQGLPSNHPSPQFGPQGGNIYSQDLFAQNNPAADNQAFDAQFLTGGAGNQGSSIDPSIFLDPQLQEQSIDPTNLMSHQMSTTAHSPTPPHLLQADISRHASASPHASPNINQGGFSAGHSRQQSLDPSAAYGQGHGGDWNGMAFRGHRRAPSDTYSDVSSNHPSPYLGNNDSFDHENPSPLLGAQQDNSMFQEVMNFGQFSLSDNPSQAGITPGHSPHISPRLAPQQHNLPPFTASNNYGLMPVVSNQPGNPSGMDMFPGSGQEPFPALNQEYGASDQMSPPEINIDFAPPSRQQSFEPPKPEGSENALSPPNRSLSRNRMRARSDPFSGASTRASTPASGNASDPASSLHPNAAKVPTSRSTSPHGLNRASRRSSTSSIPHRDYMLGLADPNRPNPNNPTSAASSPGAIPEQLVTPSPGGSKRTQKHPATFQCSLCPKRFTRAYNLRSHLRTHTDERPFVCSVCGKAFARQHDRKRHEGLHSGEKKFVCRGILKDSSGWGCGRRFARADALGRHFRSEAGRVCIRPLLEEEAAEKGWEVPAMSSPSQQQQSSHSMDQLDPLGAQPQGLSMMMPQHPQGSQFNPFVQQQQPAGFNSGMGGGMAFGLPQALLQQYPALAGIQWESLPASSNDDLVEDDAISGRSSFDASSGGEMFDDNSGWEQTLSDYEGR